MKELELTDIKEFLEITPLYSWKEFKTPAINMSSLHINEIDSHCELCNQTRPFHDLRQRGSGSGLYHEASLSTGTSYFEFTCVSCRKSKHIYLVEQVVSDNTINIQKFGELPRKKLDRDKSLQKFFATDAENYEKAVTCLSNGYGIAAFAYFRRIIENNILSLLDMLENNSKDSIDHPEIILALKKLREKTPMSEKIKAANQAIPEHLKPDGLNPLSKLYQILSEGIHTLSDAECLDRANTCKECIKFLISELNASDKNKKRFKKLVLSL